jgi:hypothetical protein
VRISRSTFSDGIRFVYTPDGFDAGLAVIKVKLGIDPFRMPPTPPSCGGLGHVNTRGLSSLGAFAIKEMMRHGMFVDIDHMSQATVNGVLNLAEANNYPLMSGHNTLREAAGSLHSENERTLEQVQRIAALHGMFGLGMAGSSALSWEVDYSRAVTAIPDPGAVALGSDLAEPLLGLRARAEIMKHIAPHEMDLFSISQRLG